MGTSGLGEAPLDNATETYRVVEIAAVTLLAALGATLGLTPDQIDPDPLSRGSGGLTRPVWVQLSWLDYKGTWTTVETYT